MSAPAALVYVDDGTVGWRRVRRGRGFAYLDENGVRIQDPEQLERLRKLAIPPAYTDVWICPDPRGHLQATARDARGRKQYRYHPRWMAQRSQAKFDRMRAFGHALPALRRAVARDLSRRTLSLNTVVAALVRLLDRTGLRIGNEAYAAHNGSYGLTTLRNRHAQTRADRLTLRFRGKSRVEQQLDIPDRSVARIARRCQELPGQRLFQFVDGQGQVHQVRSDHVNAYIRAACQEDFTAKDFRTWHASAHAMGLALRCQDTGLPPPERSALDATEAVRQVARRLGNTCAVCRKFYIHPDVLRLFEPNAPTKLSRLPRAGKGLSPEESALLRLLEPRTRSRDSRWRDSNAMKS